MKKMRLLLIFISVIVVSITIICKISYAVSDTITSTTYEIKDSTIYAVPTSNSFQVSELLENLNFSEVIDVYDASNNEVEPDDKVGSGYKVKVSDKTYTIVVLGDVTGEGTISLGDISRLYNYFKKTASLSGDKLKAGKVNKKSSVSLSDISKLYNFYKGNSAFSYYSKDHPDGITDTVNKTVNNIAALKSYDASVGQVIQTKGYTSANDGGGAKYKIVSYSFYMIENGLYVRLDNGNVAKMIIGKQTVNVKQFGAKGDGTTDDYLAFKNASLSGAVNVKIPSGTYNINNHMFTLNKYIRYVGDGQTKSIVKNGTIQAPYGVGAEGITFDGGYSQKNVYIGVGNDKMATMVFDVTPTGLRDFYYKDCAFKNVTVGIYVRFESAPPEGTRIRNGIIKGCTFTNLKRLGIYGYSPMSNVVVTDSSFTNLGGRDMLTGLINAIFLGDITNNTRYEVDNIVIKNNNFDNLMTKDNFAAPDDQEHIINANFIAIRGYNALIDHNTFSNLVGYGEDREGVYTKIQNLTVSNNTLTNCGMGEGYICAKPHFGDTYANIINNTLTGTAGVGIRTYNAGEVKKNTVNIDQSPGSLVSTGSNVNDWGKYPLIVKDNNFISGTAVGININGTEVSDYATNNRMISISYLPVPVTFENNILNPKTSFKYYIVMSNPKSDITINANKFYLGDKEGSTMVNIENGSSAPNSCLTNTTIFSNNYVESNDLLNAFARTGYKQTEDKETSRKVYFKNNTFKHNGTGNLYVLQNGNGGMVNGDTLFIEGNTSNTTKAKTHIITELKNVQNNDTDFATVTHKYNH